jgi:hypothetical protein
VCSLSFHDGKFGKLTILKEVRPEIFLCRCECGKEVEVWRSQLACDTVRHCGCLRRVAGGRKGSGHIRHFVRRSGTKTLKATREYNSWNAMRQRVENPRNSAYSDYGGRGITICKRWTLPQGEGFRNFLDDLGPRPSGKTLDRIDPQGHYEPTNCRWADAEVQANNQRRYLYPDGDMPPVEDFTLMEKRLEEELHPY